MLLHRWSRPTNAHGNAGSLHVGKYGRTAERPKGRATDGPRGRATEGAEQPRGRAAERRAAIPPASPRTWQ
eukprot:15476849-Alexandrium_andersonii.AAC.1